jgi:hypothetical protein
MPTPTIPLPVPTTVGPLICSVSLWAEMPALQYNEAVFSPTTSSPARECRGAKDRS